MLQGDEWTLTAEEARNPRAGVEKLIASFHTKPKHNKAKSAEEGRPKFDDVPYVLIMVPGDKHSIIDRPATEQDKVDFPKQWDAYLKREDQNAASGTLLEQTAIVTRSMVEELKHFKIRTVEQLANIPDGSLPFPGVLKLKQQAQAYLESAKGNAPVTKMQAALEERDNQIETLKKMLEAQASRIDDLVKKAETAQAATATVIDAVSTTKQQHQKGAR